MAKRFSFFNKQDGTSEDFNEAFSLTNQNTEFLTQVFTRKGFLDDYTHADYGFTIIKPIFTQGSSGVDYVDLDLGANEKIFGLDTNGKPLIIESNAAWVSSPTAFQDSGNQNIRLDGGFGTTQPYDRYLWLVYKEVDESTTRTDFDGAFHYPIKRHGYEIVISNLPPASYTHPTGLYIGHVNVASGSQTYDYTDVLTAGVRDSAVNVEIDPTSFKPSTYADGDIKTLRDHVNAVQDAAKISPDNPHGITGNLDGEELEEAKVIRNGIVLAANQDYISNTSKFQGTIFNSIGDNYVIVSDPGSGCYFFIDGIRYIFSDLSNYSGGSAKVQFETLTSPSDNGWYAIAIAMSGGSPILTRYKAGAPIYNEPEVNDTILLGWVYWDSSGLNLQRNETQVAINGDPILPQYSWGIWDNKNIIKHSNEYYLGNKNYIPFNPETATEGVLISSAVDSGTGGYTAAKRTVGGASVSPRSYLNIATGTPGSPASSLSGHADVYTLPNNLNAQKPAVFAKTLYTLSFNYESDVSGIETSLVVNGQTYYLSEPQSGVIKHFWITLDSYPSSVRFQTFYDSGVSNLYIYGLQLVEGIAPTSIAVNNSTYTTEVYYNKNVSQYTVGSNFEKRTWIEPADDPSLTLDSLLVGDLPFVFDPFKSPSAETGFDSGPSDVVDLSRFKTANVGAKNNIVILPFQGVFLEVGSTGEYYCDFDVAYGATYPYMPISIVPSIISGDVTVASEVIENVRVETGPSSAPTVFGDFSVKCNVRLKSAFTQVTGKTFFVQGIAILKKVN